MIPLLGILLFLTTPQAQQPVERKFYLMGTAFTVTLYAANKEEGVEHIEEVVQLVENTEHQLSTWIPESEVSDLNRHPKEKPFRLSPSLCNVLNKVRHWVEFTDGAFDPACGRIIEAWQIHGTGKIPTQASLEEAARNSGFSKLRLQNCEAVKSTDIWIDVGAFGKGDAMDRVLEVAKRKDFGPMLLDFGGQVLAWKTPPGKSDWNVAIASPLNRQDSSGVSFPLRYGSLSTSSGSERDLMVDGKRVGHIVDPNTARPVPYFGSVTVWSKDALSADALSTALYVMGPDKGYEWAVNNNVAACFLVIKGDDLEIIKTPAFEAAEKLR